MFEAEESILHEALRCAHDLNLGASERNEAFTNLIEAYGKLLRDVKFVYRISDRLQKKLSDSHQELEVGLMARSLALERAVSELSAVNKELDNFVYRASHDIKGPIARIKGLCNIALMEVTDPTSLIYIGHIVDTADMMDGILNMLLSVPNLKNAYVSPLKFSVNILLTKCVHVAKETVQFHDVHVNLPFKDVEIETDPLIMETLFENLLGYAFKSIQESIKNSKENPQPVHIETIADSETQTYTFRFRYKGEKIPEESYPQLFNMFYRSSHHALHTGLELYSSKVAAVRLNGQISMLSSNIKETEFEVKLPMKHREDHSKNVSQASSKKT
jgi:signal transduction histidine kinase